MNTHELQQLKMAWIAAKEADDTQTQVTLLRDHPDAQADMIEFIAAYSVTNETGLESDAQHIFLMPLVQRANRTALERVFAVQLQPATLQELRTQRGLSMVTAAQGLRLGIDVWKKVESGAIELVSLSEKQLARFAQFFQVSAEQFSSMLTNSQPAITLNRRQTTTAARSSQQSPKKQSLAKAIQNSTMSKEEKHLWLED